MIAPIGALQVTLVTMEEQQPTHPLSAAISYFLCRAVALPPRFWEGEPSGLART